MNAAESRPNALPLTQRLAAELAEHEPRKLLALVQEQRLTPHELFFAAEALGHVRSSTVTAVLVSLLAHESSVVREGAVYGLAHAAEYDDGAREALFRIAEHDQSEAVRRAVRDVIDF